MMTAIGRGAAMALAVCALAWLSACGGEQDELQQWMDQQKREVRPNVTPLSPPKRFDPQPYEQAAAVEPFSTQKLTVALKQVSELPVPPAELVPAISPAIDAVVLHALEKDPDRRWQNADEFIAALERLTVEADRVARIVINERTGTVVMGREVRISPVAIMHGNLAIQVSTAFDVSQPAPFSQGTTQITPRVDVGVREEKTRNVVLKDGATVDELVRALSAIGVTPRDVIAIMQNIKAAGALEADLEVI